jgi:hypothetical protein
LAVGGGFGADLGVSLGDEEYEDALPLFDESFCGGSFLSGFFAVVGGGLGEDL